MSLTLPDPALPDRFFATINDRFRRAGVETTDRAPVMTAFLAALSDVAFLDHVVSAKTDLVPCLLGALTRLSTATQDQHWACDLQAFVAYLAPRLGASVARALDGLVSEDVPALLPTHDRRRFYVDVSSAAFKVVDMYDALQTHATGNDLGQYFTPRHAVRMMAALVEVLRGKPFDAQDVVYDPAVGVGGFLVAALAGVADRPGLTARLVGMEHTASVAHMARLNLWMAGGARASILTGSSLERDYLDRPAAPGSHTLHDALPSAHPIHEVLTAGLAPTVVLMNPPFPEDRRAYQSFEFVEHALRVLAPEGFLAALIPSAVVLSEDRAHQAFRTRMLAHAQLEAVITLSSALFAPGAYVNTYLVVLRKRAGGHQLTRPVFFARCHDDGLVMDRGAGRRMGPRTSQEMGERAWMPALGWGGDMARLFADHPTACVGSGWLAAHVKSFVPIHHAHRLATSSCLSFSDLSGADWAPERFIQDYPAVTSVVSLANHIASESVCARVRQCFERDEPQTLALEPLTQACVQAVMDQLRACPDPTLAGIFLFVKGDLVNTRGLADQGPIAVISATEQGNGVCGYTAAGSYIEAPALTVAKNGRPGIARVQDRPFTVTADVAALVLRPGAPRFTRRQLPILAALIQTQAWRFSYGRKASERRLSLLNLA